MLAEAKFNNESSTEVCFPPPQETRVERQITRQPLLQPVSGCQAPAVPKWRQNPPAPYPSLNGPSTLKGLNFSGSRECWKPQPFHRMFNCVCGELRDSQEYLLITYHKAGPC